MKIVITHVHFWIESKLIPRLRHSAGCSLWLDSCIQGCIAEAGAARWVSPSVVFLHSVGVTRVLSLL